MSYAMAAALQQAIFARLSADSPLAAEVGTAIFDAAPTGTVPPLYVVMGGESVRDRSTQDAAGAEHTLVLSVVSETGGFLAAKRAAGAISDALADAGLTLERGRLVWLRFDKATARQAAKGRARRIDLHFRARVED